MVTAKGAATRARIVAAAADLILARGVGGTSLDEVRAHTGTSKSQLFHYFPGGKGEMVSAIAAFQYERVLTAQRPWLDSLDTWDAWAGWRDAVVRHYGSQPHWGCPIGSLAVELTGHDPQRATEVAGQMDRWRGHLEAGVARMRSRGLLHPETDPRRVALGVFAALHGGLALTQTMRSIEPLRAALDGALAALRHHASTAAGATAAGGARSGTAQSGTATSRGRVRETR